MKLSSFQIINCFGFRNSGEINFSSNRNFIYILGRNSSGKSTLLNAIKFFEFYKSPSEHPNFTNFNPSSETPKLVSKFIATNKKLSTNILIDNILEKLKETGINESIVENSTKIMEFLQTIREQYSQLVDAINSTKNVIVEKYEDGNFKFLLEESVYDEFENRRKEIDNAKRRFVDNKGNFRTANKNYLIKIDFESIENSLFNQFPKIYLFNEEYSLLDNLPDRISKGNINDEKNKLLSSFIDYLNRDDLNKFLISNDPDDREDFIKSFRLKVEDLCQEINTSLSSSDFDEKLFEIVIHENEGLQLTVKTDKKKSFYNHLSDNTKFLFAYFLYKKVNNIKNDILLFDEPNNGFHPSAQVYLLNFLQTLANDGNTIILSTHSEYLIDLKYITDIRIMGSDENHFLTVRNRFYTPPINKGDYLALQPLYDSIGLKYGFLMNIRDSVILTEGITDLLYLKAFIVLLNYKNDINIAPARSDSHILTLVPFFISQGISIKIILDKGSTVKNKLINNYEFKENCIWEVPVPDEFKNKFKKSGIEDLFSRNDFLSMIRKFDNNFNEKEFSSISNSIFVRDKKYKSLIAHNFLDQICNAKKNQFDKRTIENFTNILEYCLNKNWYNFIQ